MKLKKFLLWITIIITQSSAFGFNMPAHTGYTRHITLDSQKYLNIKIDSITQRYRWDSTPTGQFGEYAATSFFSRNGVHAYMGIQYDSTSRKAIFSFWDKGVGTNTAMPAANSGCNRFTHEDSGTQCIINYNWVQGRTYELTVRKDPQASTTQYEQWVGFITDLATGSITKIGAINISNIESIGGYGGINIYNGVLNFTEYYGPAGTYTCNQTSDFRVTFSKPLFNSYVPADYMQKDFKSIANVEYEACKQSDVRINGDDTYTHYVGYGTTRMSTDLNVNLSYGPNSIPVIVTGPNTTAEQKVECLFSRAQNTFQQSLPSMVNNKQVLTYKAGGMYIRNYYGSKINGQPSAIALALIPFTGQILLSDASLNVTTFNDFYYWVNRMQCDV